MYRCILVFVSASLACSSGGSKGDTATCPLPATTDNAGTLAVTKAQRCNQVASKGELHWYRLVATWPGSTVNYVQVELHDQVGAFAGSTVHTGMFPVDTDPKSCGVCVRGMGDKGAAGAKEYFADGGMVNVTAVGAAGAPITATLSNISFAEVDSSGKVVSAGCTADVAAAQLSGNVVEEGGSGDNTGSGGGPGRGGGGCPQTVGD